MADDPELPEDEAPDARPEGVPDLGDARTVREQRKRIKRLEQERAEVLRTLLSTEAGRRWYSWLLHDVCGIYRPVANQAFDPHGLHFKEGARAVGQVLHDTALNTARNQYIVCLAENLHNP